MLLEQGAQNVGQLDDHLPCQLRLHAHQRGDGVQSVKQKMRVDLALQGIEPGLEQQALLLFELHLDAQRVPHLERNAHIDGRAEVNQRLQPPLASDERKKPVRKFIGYPVPAGLGGRDKEQHQNLAIQSRLEQVAAHPAVQAQVDEGRE